MPTVRSGPSVRLMTRSVDRPGVLDAGTPMVLMYHSIAPRADDPYLVTVDPARFTRQVRWLRRRGLRGVAMRDLLAARATGSATGLVGLTFDDGYADFVEYVLPVLRRNDFTATVFVIAGRLGGENEWDPQGPRKPLLTERQVHRVAAAGMEIGSHSLTHVSLPALEDAALTEEIGHSRKVLCDIADQDVPGFCYPYGHLDARVAEAVRAAGYDYGCAIWRSDLTGRHALPRTYVGNSDSGLRLRAKWWRHRIHSR